LARQLVSNLSSTFNELASLIGRDRQKQYVRRFASEAFAFLLRRAQDPNEIVVTMLSDLDDNEDYSEGVMNIFIESMKAPGRNLHSKAVPLFNALVHNVYIAGLFRLELLTRRNRIFAALTTRCHNSSPLEH
jgi:U3 small nucleolar RNA-associated protein 20